MNIGAVKKGFENATTQELERLCVEGASKVVAYATEATPVSKSRKGHTGGRLRKGWELSNLIKSGNSGFKSRKIIVYNAVEYAVHVEYGHRTRLGTGKTHGKGKGKRVVDGVFMLKRALEKVADSL